jgi:cysteine-rich repeat protein
LQTIAHELDDLVPVILTGADGIGQTSATGDDIQLIPVGQGFKNTFCVSTGPDGKAQTTVCGNDIPDAEENGIPSDNECDDGNIVDGDGCSSICVVEFCGDGVPNDFPNEECDDGNSNNRDDCLNTCQLPTCGDGFVHNEGTAPFEECDDGGTIDGDGCTADCMLEFCGDGVVNDSPNEECDNGEQNSDTEPDVCRTDCRLPHCGDEVVDSGEQCDDGNTNGRDDCPNTCQLPTCGDGFVHDKGTAPFEECDDGGTIDGDGCTADCRLEFCGDGVANDFPNEECEDGNQNGEDDCTNDCKLPICGDGFVHNEGTAPFEECDDGNRHNDDACLVGCINASCGDGFLQRGVEQCEPPNTPTCGENCLAILPPFCGDNVVDPPEEECDDGNNSNKDDCLNTCQIATCGDGFLHASGTPPLEECDDGNAAPGDGCSRICEIECGNGVIDGACVEGTVGLECSTDEDCDTGAGAGDGVCIAETCDPGAANLCLPGPETCSDVCGIEECGNAEVECAEQCDLGPANGVPGSGCEADCTRNVIGRRDVRGKSDECPSAWTLDAAPRDQRRTTQVCTDGDPCDFDAIPGQCTFRVGVCLNRPGVPGCTLGGLSSFDLRLKVNVSDQAAVAAEIITAAVAKLAPSSADVPGRCRRGLRGKVCSIPDNPECDTFFGAGDGICDVGTGVLFDPPLDPQDQGGDQISPCTPGKDIVVSAGARLKLRSLVHRTTGKRDRDMVRLLCEP